MMRILITIFIVFLCFKAHSQKEISTSFNVSQDEIRPLKRGDNIPNVLFVSKENFPKEIKAVHDYKGKLVLLDFWSTGCSSCIAAFPKMERLQKKYGNRLQIILINPWETRAEVDKRMASKINSGIKYPDIPRINGDSIWMQLFPTRSVPHHVWLDTIGNIIAVTGGYNANEKTIEALLKGEDRNMILKPFLSKMDLSNISFIEKVSNNLIRPELGANFYSFYEGEGSTVYGFEVMNVVDSPSNTIRLSFVNTTPIRLVNMLLKQIREVEAAKAYLSDELITLKIKDTSVFQNRVPYEYYDEWSRKVKFCMEVVLPLEQRQQIYQYTFDQFKNYIQTKFKILISIEEQERPCLILVQKHDTHLLQTKGRKMKKDIFNEGGVKNISYTNTAFSSVFRSLKTIIRDSNVHCKTLLNEVPYDGNVDMTLPDIYGQPDRLPELKRALNKYGLDLIERDRKVMMVVATELEP